LPQKSSGGTLQLFRAKKRVVKALDKIMVIFKKKR
jgi:hypothetical protein